MVASIVGVGSLNDCVTAEIKEILLYIGELRHSQYLFLLCSRLIATKSAWEQHRTKLAPADQPQPPLWIDGTVPIRVKSQLQTLTR